MKGTAGGKMGESALLILRLWEPSQCVVRKTKQLHTGWLTGNKTENVTGQEDWRGREKNNWVIGLPDYLILVRFDEQLTSNLVKVK